MEELGQGSGAWERSSRSKWSQRQRQGCSRAVEAVIEAAAVRQCGSGHRASRATVRQRDVLQSGSAAEECVGRNIYGARISQTVLN